jgi:hypothetical protein
MPSGFDMSCAAHVVIDDRYASLATWEDGSHIFLTPYGDCRGLYVSNCTEHGFDVRELGGGESDIEFSHRIVAPKATPNAGRVPEIAIPEVLQRKWS